MDIRRLEDCKLLATLGSPRSSQALMGLCLHAHLTSPLFQSVSTIESLMQQHPLTRAGADALMEEVGGCAFFD